MLTARGKACCDGATADCAGTGTGGKWDCGGVAPGIPWLGVFLPYAPLQHLLFADGRVRALVMTSANLSEEPIAIENGEALARLGGIANAFLMHDREILQRCDDSVAAVVDGRAQLIRRARGFVPLGVELPRRWDWRRGRCWRWAGT